MAKNIGVLWDAEVEWERETPFGEDEATNKDYEVYSELAEEREINLFIAKYNWYSEGGLSQAWKYDGEKWTKVEKVRLDGVYDKFKFDAETRKLKKTILENLEVLNNYELEELCKDKYMTYKEFPDYVPETRLATRENVEEMLDKYDKVLIKPRYDFGGRGIKVIESPEEAEHYDEDPEEYIVQRFVDSSKGIPELGIEGMHDLRAILINGEIAEVYVRQPKEGYLSNTHLGGTQTYFDIEKYPESARKITEEVKKKFEKYDPSIYSVDLIYDSQGKPWILELNSKPGVGYHKDTQEKEYQLPAMRKVIEALDRL